MPDKNDNLNDGVEDSIKHFVVTVFGTEDHTAEFLEKEREENKVMAFLSYVIPPLPFLVERTSKYVKFHSNQGMNLLVYLLICMITAWILNIAFNNHRYVQIFQRIYLILYMVFCCIGIYNALNDKAREIPLASKFNWIDIFCNFFGIEL